MFLAKIIEVTPFELKTYKKNELAKLYGLTLYELNKWIDELQPEFGKMIGQKLSIRQVQLFATKYGIPGRVVQQETKAAA